MGLCYTSLLTSGGGGSPEPEDGRRAQTEGLFIDGCLPKVRRRLFAWSTSPCILHLELRSSGDIPISPTFCLSAS